MAVAINRKQHFNKRLNNLKSERTSFISLWRELSDYHLANRGRFLVSDRNKGDRRNTKQINNTSRRAVRTIASGMMAGITSPARPWFKLAMNDKELMNLPEVKAWLVSVERIMREIFNQSNLYNSLHNVYQELSVFGTASLGVFEDFDNVIRTKTYTVGSYFLGLNGKDQVDTWAREYQLSVSQVVDQFGYDQCSKSVQNQWDTGNTEAWVDVIHMIEPNDDRDHMSPLAKDKRFRSVYYERASKKNNTQDQFLRESGFDGFPMMNPRWEVTGEDVYGTSCPGIDAIGDVKGLQLSEKMLYEGIEKRNDPHMIAPANLRNVISPGLIPGEISFVDGSSTDGLRPAYQFDPKIQDMNADIARVENRIDKSFYVDLFLMLANTNRRQITAREISERHEEKLLMLGPVLERLHNELLDPLIDRTFEIGLDAGIFGQIPDVLSEKAIKVEYISVLAQAQRLVEASALENVAGYISDIAGVWPEARHKFDAAASVDQYAESIGVSPDIIKTDDQFKAAVAAEAEQVAAAQRAAVGPQMSKSAKELSETDTEGKNALTDMMRRAGVPTNAQ